MLQKCSRQQHNSMQRYSAVIKYCFYGFVFHQTLIMSCADFQLLWSVFTSIFIHSPPVLRHDSKTWILNMQTDFFFYDFRLKYYPSQSSDLSPTEHVFDFLKTRLKAKRPQNKQEVKMLPVQAWQHHQGRYKKSVNDLQPNIR